MNPTTVKIAYDWGVRSFGEEHMRDAKVRALRAAEEAVEVAQSVGVPRDMLHRQVDATYDREPGTTPEEIGGALMTLAVMAYSLGHDPVELFNKELHRVLSKSPEHFAARNREKLQLGLRGDSGK